jgi:hypothetical protein
MISDLDKIDVLMDEGNYLAAYLRLRRLSEDDPAREEYLGLIAMRIIDELGNQPARGNRERVFYLRSLLLSVFKEVPGLARLYKEQLYTAEQPVDSLGAFMKNMKAFNDVATGKRDMADVAEETIENIKNRMEDAGEEAQSADTDQQVKDFFDLAGEGLREGIKNVSSFFDSVSKPTPGSQSRTERDAGSSRSENTARSRPNDAESSERRNESKESKEPKETDGAADETADEDGRNTRKGDT